MTISVRDANLRPVADASVDVQSASTDRVDENFNVDATINDHAPPDAPKPGPPTGAQITWTHKRPPLG